MIEEEDLYEVRAYSLRSLLSLHRILADTSTTLHHECIVPFDHAAPEILEPMDAAIKSIDEARTAVIAQIGEKVADDPGGIALELAEG